MIDRIPVLRCDGRIGLCLPDFERFGNAGIFINVGVVILLPDEPQVTRQLLA